MLIVVTKDNALHKDTRILPAALDRRWSCLELVHLLVFLLHSIPSKHSPSIRSGNSFETEHCIAKNVSRFHAKKAVTSSMDDDFQYAAPAELPLLLKTTKNALTVTSNHTYVNVTSFLKKDSFDRFDDQSSPLTKLNVQKEETDRRSDHSQFVPPFNQSDISRLCRHGGGLHLLLFDGHNFKLFGVGKYTRYGNWQKHFMGLIVDGLLSARRQRFTNNSAPFQVLLSSMNDFVYYNCVDNKIWGCSRKNYPPLLTPSSVPTNSSAASFLKQFPISNYNKCVYDWRRNESTTNCVVEELVTMHRNTSEAWDTLEPQLFWRGADLGFIRLRAKQCMDVLPQNRSNCILSKRQAADILLREPNLQPRCRAVAMTLDLEANQSSSRFLQHERQNSSGKDTLLEPLPWINVKFFNDSRGSDWQTCGQTVAPYTRPKDMANYKYQIDFSGIGGTTWLGTISKLAMPGLLFHHEAPTKDWFHDDIHPWVHYVPVNMNVSNLEDMFRWAESHPEQAKRIAQQAQDFAREQVTHRLYQATFEKMFVQVLGRIVDAYRPALNETLHSILQGYQADGLVINELGICNEDGCQVKPELSD